MGKNLKGFKKFKKDAETGKVAEKLFIELLETFWQIQFKLNDSSKREELAKWDIEIISADYTIKFEIKYDVMSAKTGNVAIEYFNPKTNKPSGITATGADFWIYVLPDKSVWMASVARLKDYLQKNAPYRIVDVGGDNNASMYLYKKDKILSEAFLRIDGWDRYYFRFAMDQYKKVNYVVAS